MRTTIKDLLYTVWYTPPSKYLLTCRPRWQRMPSSHVFYHRSPAHNNAYVLSFAFCFDAENEVYQFAMCQPFTYSRHKVRPGKGNFANLNVNF